MIYGTLCVTLTGVRVCIGSWCAQCKAVVKLMFDSCVSNTTVSAFLYEEVARSIASGAVARAVVAWCGATTTATFTGVRSPTLPGRCLARQLTT